MRKLIASAFRIYSFLRTTVWSSIVKLQCAEFSGVVRANRNTKVTKKTILGRNVNFNGMHIMGCGKVVIGDNFHSGSECQIITSIHNYDTGNAIPYDKKSIHSNVEIQGNVWLGNRVIILAGVNIGEGAIVQAGSVVVSDVPPCSIVGGHPAKVFAMRDIEHYEKLKALKSYY